MASLILIAAVFKVVLSAQQFEWNTVAIGGGGYVTGLVQIGDSYIYSRTDVSSNGIYLLFAHEIHIHLIYVL